MKNKTPQAPETSRQWGVGSNGAVFRPMGSSQGHVPAGTYIVEADMGGIFLRKHPTVTDTMMVLPDTQIGALKESFARFWDREKLYRKHGLTHKRGVILHGPPGTGKTSIIHILADMFVEKYDGIVLFARDINALEAILKQIRQIEPTRKLMVVLEDIDHYIEYGDETDLLSLLDGENQVNGIIYIATTNNIGKLPARVVNRPSRFDEINRIGYPTSEARRAYLDRMLEDHDAGLDLAKWVKDTNGFSMAHLKELAVSVAFLELDYAKTLKRLKTMAEKQTSESGFYTGEDEPAATAAKAS